MSSLEWANIQFTTWLSEIEWNCSAYISPSTHGTYRLFVTRMNQLKIVSLVMFPALFGSPTRELL